MLGTTGLTAELTLANGTAGQSGLASLDVNSLGADLIGPTGGSLVASGLVQSYTASLTAGTTGTQTEMFSLNAGDDHTLSGASPPVDLSTSVALTVVANRLVTASSANFGLVHEGTAVGQAITLSTSGDDSHFTRVTVGNAGPDANGISVGGGSNPLFNGESVTDQRILGGAFSTIGTVVGVITLTTSGEGLSGEAPINVPVSYTAQVYSGKAQWNAASGDWNSGNWTDILGGGPSGPPGLSGFAADTATFGPGFSGGTAAVLLNGDGPTLSALAFSNSATGFSILQGAGTTGLTLTSAGAENFAAMTVLAGTDSVAASLLLESNLVVGSSGLLTLSGEIGDGGQGYGLTLAGTGSLILAGFNTYGGGTQVAGGTLYIVASDSLPQGTSLAVGAGGTLIFDPMASASPIEPAASTGVAAVPEPGTLAILLAGIGFHLAFRRVRRCERLHG